MKSRIHFAWQCRLSELGHRTGVSLHSHTSHSKETLDFIPRITSHFALLREALRIYEARYRRIHGRELDYTSAWWTPPLGPREALLVERGQIEEAGLNALVSISDHDNIEAPLLLRVLSEGGEVPISTEWTVPYRGVFLHVGFHNLPRRRAAERMAELSRFTANPQEKELEGLLEWLAEIPETLVVLNHPYWDEKGVGQERHNQVVETFLFRYRRYIHALELNGLRPWSENRQTMGLASARRIPLISGGDRHGSEPNALINLSHGRSFDEFVAEVREDGYSVVAVMPQYREPLTLRVILAIGDVMRDNDSHTHGWRKWSDRVFYQREGGEAESLSAIWARSKEPTLVKQFVAISRLMEHRRVKAGLRQLFPPVQEFS
ncbi:MAG: hypothetical protein HXY18_08915 [Bryobacteraceae bacterium]|nr:hypothetical protein [Bryobacteraceae bacterium]